MAAARWLWSDAHPGWLTGCGHYVSPNQDARPDDCVIDLAVIHCIALPPEQFGGVGVEQLFSNQLDPQAHPYYAQIADLRVSAHFLIYRDGRLQQFVSTTRRAWHAGVSQFQQRQACNDFSIGIELEGSTTRQFESPQYDSLLRLLSLLQARHPLRYVAGHDDIAPGRKTDPGPYFEWPKILQGSGLIRTF